jgi:hypothetical protein
MFHMRQHVVEATGAAEAIRLLGWGECAVGPVAFGGVRFWAGIDVDGSEHARRVQAGIGPVLARDVLAEVLASGDLLTTLRPAVSLLGCLVVGHDAITATQDASLLAGYAPRAVLVSDTEELVALTVDAALLDQGVVVSQGSNVQLLTNAGPRVAGDGFDAREWELLETVYAAWLASPPMAAGARFLSGSPIASR